MLALALAPVYFQAHVKKIQKNVSEGKFSFD
jgi:hypothetical protein